MQVIYKFLIEDMIYRASVSYNQITNPNNNT